MSAAGPGGDLGGASLDLTAPDTGGALRAAQTFTNPGGTSVAAPAAADGGAVANVLKSLGIDSAGGVLKGIGGVGTLLNAGLLGTALAKGPGKIPQIGNLQAHANDLGAQGKQLTSGIETGTLPPGAQKTIDDATAQAVTDAQAQIRSQFAAQGLSGSSMEAQALADVSQRAATEASTQKLALMQSLLQTGIQETGMSDKIFQDIMSAQLSQDQALQAAISNFAQGVGGSRNPNITVNTNG